MRPVTSVVIDKVAHHSKSVRHPWSSTSFDKATLLHLYILPGKFSSDPIEGRFGWYRQTNGGNFYTSINQLCQAEKKIRCISLLKQDALHQIANLTFGDIPSHPVSDNSLEGIRLHDFLSGSTVDDMTDSDTSVTYYVSGYACRSISRRRKCSSCKNLLVDSDELVSILDDMPSVATDFFQAANRGGLSVPTDHCFGVCCFAVQLHNCILANESARSKLLSAKNQKAAFIFAVTKFAESKMYVVLAEQTCVQGHNNFALILQTIFNCFAKNELKRINQCTVAPSEKIASTLTKLNSQTSLQ